MVILEKLQELVFTDQARHLLDLQKSKAPKEVIAAQESICSRIKSGGIFPFKANGALNKTYTNHIEGISNDGKVLYYFFNNYSVTVKVPLDMGVSKAA